MASVLFWSDKSAAVSVLRTWATSSRIMVSSCDHVSADYMCVASADMGDQPWEAELPAEALVEIKAAKGTVYEMGAKPWWCAPPALRNKVCKGTVYEMGAKPWWCGPPALRNKVCTGTVYEMGAKPWWCGPHGRTDSLQGIQHCQLPKTLTWLAEGLGQD